MMIKNYVIFWLQETMYYMQRVGPNNNKKRSGNNLFWRSPLLEISFLFRASVQQGVTRSNPICGFWLEKIPQESPRLKDKQFFSDRASASRFFFSGLCLERGQRAATNREQKSDQTKHYRCA
eukprot:GEMP01068027.1.p1 GENE.GEMP01068027.1~~GEMP01068027.1.p1  ORF type:complete len:122 (+),score=8.45 GEMP01068027.1:876-1241(+)